MENAISEKQRMFKKQNVDLVYSRFSKLVIPALLSLVACYTGGTVISLAISVIFVIYALVQPIRLRAYIVILCLVNTKGLAIGGISASVIICFLSSVYELISKKKMNVTFFSWCCIYLIYSLQFCFRPAGIEYGVIFPIKMVTVLLFYYRLSKEKTIRINGVDFVLEASCFYFVGALSASIGSIGGSGRFATYGNDPNALGLQMAFLFSAFCVLYFRFNRLSTIQFAIFSSGTLLIGALTGSRTYLILAGFVVVASIVLNINKMKKTIWFLFAIVVCIVLFLLSDVGQHAILVLINRQNVLSDQGNFSNGRFDLWLRYIDYLNDNRILWFIGAGSYVFTGIEQVPHNMIIEGIVCYGLFGIIILFQLYKKIIKSFFSYRSHTKKNIYIFLPLIVVLVGNLFLHDLTNIYNTTMIFLSVIFIVHQSE